MNSSLVNYLFRSFLNIAPDAWKLPLEYHFRKLKHELEPETFYLHELIDRPGIAIDVGANKGYYSYALAQLPQIERIEAFEPQPWCCEPIAAYARRAGKNINVRTSALSDTNSTLELNIPLLRGRMNTTLSVGLASFKKPDVEHQTVAVPVCRLDDCNLTKITFIKIDVEGHEESAIVGGKQTILRERPTLLIEIENRHLYDNQTGIKDVKGIVELVESLGYDTYFLDNRQLLPFAKINWIDSECGKFKMATYGDRYIYNFIFKPQ